MKGKSRGLNNSVRIIAGKWRGRKLVFPEIEGLRPTPDRVRETVFNWLQSQIRDAQVLDLYAGSGAFGFEALSRGAGYVLFVEQNPTVASQLKQNLNSLKAENAEVIQTDALQFLQRNVHKQFDIVILDPPYAKNLLAPSFQYLQNQAWLQQNAYIYFEAESSLKNLALPKNWHMHRSKQAGQVGYHLARKITENLTQQS